MLLVHWSITSSASEQKVASNMCWLLNLCVPTELTIFKTIYSCLTAAYAATWCTNFKHCGKYCSFCRMRFQMLELYTKNYKKARVGWPHSKNVLVRLVQISAYLPFIGGITKLGHSLRHLWLWMVGTVSMALEGWWTWPTSHSNISSYQLSGLCSHNFFTLLNLVF